MTQDDVTRLSRQLFAVLLTAADIEPETMTETSAYLAACKGSMDDWERVKGRMVSANYATFDGFHRIHLTDEGRARVRQLQMVFDNAKVREGA